MYKDIEILKKIEESGWNIKELAIKLIESERMNDQLIEKLQKLKEVKEDLEEEMEEKNESFLADSEKV